MTESGGGVRSTCRQADRYLATRAPTRRNGGRACEGKAALTGLINDGRPITNKMPPRHPLRCTVDFGPRGMVLDCKRQPPVFTDHCLSVVGISAMNAGCPSIIQTRAPQCVTNCQRPPEVADATHRGCQCDGLAGAACALRGHHAQCKGLQHVPSRAQHPTRAVQQYKRCACSHICLCSRSLQRLILTLLMGAGSHLIVCAMCRQACDTELAVSARVQPSEEPLVLRTFGNAKGWTHRSLLLDSNVGTDIDQLSCGESPLYRQDIPHTCARFLPAAPGTGTDQVTSWYLTRVHARQIVASGVAASAPIKDSAGVQVNQPRASDVLSTPPRSGATGAHPVWKHELAPQCLSICLSLQTESYFTTCAQAQRDFSVKRLPLVLGNSCRRFLPGLARIPTCPSLVRKVFPRLSTGPLTHLMPGRPD